jgi:hypothetical protein
MDNFSSEEEMPRRQVNIKPLKKPWKALKKILKTKEEVGPTRKLKVTRTV